MDNEKKTFKRGAQRDLAGYFLQHPDKLVTIDDLEKHFDGRWDRRQIMHAMSPSAQGPMASPTLKAIEKLQTGVWRLVTDKQVEPAKQNDNMLLVEVLKERSTHLIVEDTNDGKIYKMILVG